MIKKWREKLGEVVRYLSKLQFIRSLETTVSFYTEKNNTRVNDLTTSTCILDLCTESRLNMVNSYCAKNCTKVSEHSFIYKSMYNARVPQNKLMASAEDGEFYVEVTASPKCTVYIHKDLNIIFKMFAHLELIIIYDNKLEDIVMEFVRSLFTDITDLLPATSSKETNVLFLVKDGHGAMFTPMDMAPNSKYVKKDYKYNYSPDILESYVVMRDNILAKQSGLYILYGDPGCGKTALIYRLIDELSSKSKDYRVIYCTPEILSILGTPEFTALLIELRRNCKGPIVLLLEDAGEFIEMRDSRDSATTAILNLTDGLLGTMLGSGINFIISYNKEGMSVDQALLRNGRLKRKLHFLPLDPDQVMEWCTYHKVPELYNSMPLCDLYTYKATIKTGEQSDDMSGTMPAGLSD